MSIPQELESIPASEMDTTALAEILDGFGLLADLNFPEKRVLAQHMLGYRAKPGTFVFHEGDPGSFLCFVLDGRVELVKTTAGEPERHLGAIGAGKTVGEMALIDGEPRSASAYCPKQVDIAVLTKESFERLSATHATLALRFILKLAKLVSQRLRQTTGQLVDHLGG